MNFRALAVLSLIFASSARAQVPAGPEFLVNTYTTERQNFTSVSVGPTGDIVVAWDSAGQDGSFEGTFAQRYDAAGTPWGSEFAVNSYTTGNQFMARAVATRKGQFSVIFAGPSPGDAFLDVFARRYGPVGPMGGEARVNAYTTSHQAYPDASSDAQGNVVVVWGNSAPSGGAYARRLDPSGQPVGAEVRVGGSSQTYPRVASDPAGNFVVTWSSYQDGNGHGVFAQRYDRNGARRGGEFQVNVYTTGRQAPEGIALDRDGNFVIVWSSQQDGSASGVYARRYAADGTPSTGEFQVNSHTTSSQYFAAVASDRSGNFVITWLSHAQDGDGLGVFAKRYAASGVPRGPEFLVNSYTTSHQYHASVASDAVGNFTVTWASPNDGSLYGVYARRFGGLVPAAVAVDPTDAGGNRVLEAGEVASVRPSWRNLTGSTQPFTSVASSFGGPPGPLYSIADATADYGSVAAGDTASCSSTANCLAVAINGSRPLTHWDAVLQEDILPDAQGQSMSWILHVGESFTDVPRTSGFYRFVETMLHRGVTGGCTTSTFCPSSSTTREQMAVFALVSREGEGYVPPACVAGSEMFVDLPASNPFCRWVEELARRGVVGGCGGGGYCPAQPVVREQMAIFALRTLEGASYTPPACGTPMYADVPASSPFCRWIEELTRRGVVSGCGGGNYCPAVSVSREQMSVFLTVTFGLTLYGL